jgi:hypothetical protein
VKVHLLTGFRWVSGLWGSTAYILLLCGAPPHRELCCDVKKQVPTTIAVGSVWKSKKYVFRFFDGDVGIPVLNNMLISKRSLSISREVHRQKLKKPVPARHLDGNVGNLAFWEY